VRYLDDLPLKDEIEYFLQLGFELTCAEIFLNVVADACFDAFQDGLFVILCREHDDSGIPAGGADLAKGLESAFPRKTVGHDNNVELTHHEFAVATDSVNRFNHLCDTQRFQNGPV